MPRYVYMSRYLIKSEQLNYFTVFVYNFILTFFYTAKCTEDSGCSGSTDSCDTATGVCKCGPNDACSGNTPMCDGGDCKGNLKWLGIIFNRQFYILMCHYIWISCFYFVEYSGDAFWCEHLDDLEEDCKHEKEKEQCPVKCCPFVKPIEDCPNPGNECFTNIRNPTLIIFYHSFRIIAF